MLLKILSKQIGLAFTSDGRVAIQHGDHLKPFVELRKDQIVVITLITSDRSANRGKPFVYIFEKKKRFP